MNSSISSFRSYVVAIASLLLVSVLMLAGLSEWLLRSRVLPNDGFAWSFDRFLTSTATDILIGDSHMSQGGYGIAGFINLSMANENASIFEAKIKAYYRDREIGRVVLQADAHVFAASRDTVDISKRLAQYANGSRPTVWILDPNHRVHVFTYWRRFFGRSGFSNVFTFQPNGAITSSEHWSNTELEARIRLTAARVELQRPPPDPKQTEAALVYERIMQFLSDRGAAVCLVSMPVTPLYMERISAYAEYAASMEFFRRLAALHGATYLDLRTSIGSLDLFLNQDHVNLQGATSLAPQIAEGCFPP